MKNEIFVVLESQNKANSEVQEVLYRGKPVNFKVLNNKKAKQAAAFQLIIKELESSETLLKKAIHLYESLIEKFSQNEYIDLSEPDALVVSSIYNAAVVSYCKCFNSSDGRRVRLNERDVFKEVGATIKREHSEIKRYRDNYVAHAGNSEFEFGRAIACLTQLPNESPISIIANACFGMKQKFEMEKSLELVIFVKETQIARQASRLNALTKELNLSPERFDVLSLLNTSNQDEVSKD